MNSLKTLATWLLFSFCFLFISACNDDDNPLPTPAPPPETPAPGPAPETRNILIGASLGLVRNADIRLIEPGTGNAIEGATGVLDESGMATLTIPADFAGSLAVIISGNADSMYFDESANAFLSFPEGKQIRAFLPSPQDEVGVTTFTEIAAALLHAAGTLDAQSIALVNNSVANMFLPGAGDITALPTILGELTQGSTSSDVAGWYATALGAITTVGARSDTPALDMMTTLSADLMDGVINGALGDQVFANAVYSADVFLPAYIAALTEFVNTYGDDALQADFAHNNYAASLQVALTGVEEILNNIDISAVDLNIPQLPEPPLVLPQVLSEVAVLLQFTTANNGAPYNLDQIVGFEISAAGALSIDADPDNNNGNEATLESFRIAPSGEVIWSDSTAGIDYAFSYSTNGINEVNLFSSSGDFLGQFTEIGDLSGGNVPNLELLTRYAGSYDVEAVSGTHDRGTVSILEDGTVDFDSSVFWEASAIVQIFDRTAIEGEPRVQVNYGADDDGPAIQLFLTTDLQSVAQIQFRHRSNNVDITVNVVTSGEGEGGGAEGGTVPPDSASADGIAATVNGQGLVFSEQQSIVLVPGFRVGATIEIPDGYRVSAVRDPAQEGSCQQCENLWSLTFVAEVGTHPCEHITTGRPGDISLITDSVQVNTQGNGFIAPECEIIVEEMTDNSIRGTFKATLIQLNEENENEVFAEVTDGVFNVKVE